MITREQYEEYKQLIEEYEQAEFEDGCRDAEEDDFDDDPFECDDCGYSPCRCEQIENCTCGAWSKTGAHIADCICGAG